MDMNCNAHLHNCLYRNSKLLKFSIGFIRLNNVVLSTRGKFNKKII